MKKKLLEKYRDQYVGKQQDLENQSEFEKLSKERNKYFLIFIIWLKICLNDKHGININEMAIQN